MVSDKLFIYIIVFFFVLNQVNLIASTKSQNEVKSRFLLNVIIAERTALFQLFTSEDKALLVRGDAFLILDFGFYVLDSVAGLDFEGDSFSGECFDEDLHDLRVTKTND